ncbi:MAG: GAF domain-containing protein [Caldilineae bacterium]|nr:MAG: GAF domain-containing protein [Caldilineae bacterium]
MNATPALSLEDVLRRLNRIGAAINALGDEATVETTLRLIVENATEVVPGSSAVIYTYDGERGAFDASSRVAVGELATPMPGDEPRAEGMGMRAIRQKRRILSYEDTDISLHQVKSQQGARVVACYPLIVSEQPVGVLYVYLPTQRPFTPTELLMLDNFVNLAAMAINQARQMNEVRRYLERKEEELKRLRQADFLISSRLGLQETLEAILQMALEVTGARYGILRLKERNADVLVTRAIAGDDLGRPAVEALPINTTSITGWVAKYRQPLCIADVHSGPWARIYYPLDHEMEMRSELAVPLLGAGGRLEGVINLESPEIGAFSEDDSLLLQSLATQAVIALQEIRLLDALLELSERLLTASDQEFFDHLVTLTCDLLNAPVSALWTVEGEELILRSSNGGFRRGQRIPLHASLTGEAVLQRRLVTAEDLRSDPRFRHGELARTQGWTQALIAPLAADETSTPVGALSVYNTTNDDSAFAATDWDKKVLTALAHHAALAVQNARRKEALLQAQEQQAAAETFAAMGDIAANLLHRLNNKIGTIPVRVEGIQDKSAAVLAADPYLARNLAEIERSAVEAMETLRDSLSYLRPFHLAPVDVAAVVRQALDTLDVPQGIRIETDNLVDLPPVTAGRERLVLVFVNLLENAITAMQGEGTITIRAEPLGHRLEIRVSDTGPGIPPELQDRIFDFNYSGAKRASGKLGFGLWWVRTIMARFGGGISVQSDGRHGTTFILTLPLSQTEP